MASIDPAIQEAFNPCPFCKEKLDIYIHDLYAEAEGVHVSLECKNCDIVFQYCNDNHTEDPHEDPEALLKWWNGITWEREANEVIGSGFWRAAINDVLEEYGLTDTKATDLRNAIEKRAQEREYKSRTEE